MLPFLFVSCDLSMSLRGLCISSSSSFSALLFSTQFFLYFPTVLCSPFGAHKRGVFYFRWFWCTIFLHIDWLWTETPKIHKTRKSDAEEENAQQWRNSVPDFCAVGGMKSNEIGVHFVHSFVCIGQMCCKWIRFVWRENAMNIVFFSHWINFELILRHFLWIFAVE